MFSRASSTGSRLKNWKTKPTLSRRSSVSSASSSAPRSTPSIDHGARGRAVEPGEAVHQRRLAGARRAHDRRQPPSGKPTVTPSSARTAASPSPKTRLRSVALTIESGGVWFKSSSFPGGGRAWSRLRAARSIGDFPERALGEIRDGRSARRGEHRRGDVGDPDRTVEGRARLGHEPAPRRRGPGRRRRPRPSARRGRRTWSPWSRPPCACEPVELDRADSGDLGALPHREPARVAVADRGPERRRTQSAASDGKSHLASARERAARRPGAPSRSSSACDVRARRSRPPRAPRPSPGIGVAALGRAVRLGRGLAARPRPAPAAAPIRGGRRSWSPAVSWSRVTVVGVGALLGAAGGERRAGERGAQGDCQPLLSRCIFRRNRAQAGVRGVAYLGSRCPQPSRSSENAANLAPVTHLRPVPDPKPPAAPRRAPRRPRHDRRARALGDRCCASSACGCSRSPSRATSTPRSRRPTSSRRSTTASCATTRSSPDWPERDRFVLCKGHAAPIQYAALAHHGYFPLEDLMGAAPDRRPAPGPPGHEPHPGRRGLDRLARPGPLDVRRDRPRAAPRRPRRDRAGLRRALRRRLPGGPDLGGGDGGARTSASPT